MIPNITRGTRMQGLVSYLVSTDADKTHNVHQDPHLVGGDAAIMAWFDDGILDQKDANEIAAYLDEPRRSLGVEVMRRDPRKNAPKDAQGKPQLVKADVWHCSLSLAAGEREMTDQEWGDIANEFVDKLGFTDTSEKAPCRWAAIDHGTSKAGNQHIHIAVSLVREDGTKASVHMDQPKSQKVCRELEKKYGLEELNSVHASRGYDRAEPQTAKRQEREMHRTSLERKVRAASTAATTEAGFVREGRNIGLLMRPRYAKNTTDVVIGYSAAERPTKGERPIWFGGGKLARDLGLGQLRAQWPDTAQDSLDAVAEWNAAARNKRQANPSKPRLTTAEMWETNTKKAKEMADRLQSIPLSDHATWAKAARQTSGVFSAWANQSEDGAGPLANTAAELSKTAQLRDYRQHGKPVQLPSLAGSTMLLLAAGSKSKTAAQSALLMQLMRTAKAVHDMHQQSKRTRESQRLMQVFSTDLGPFARAMPEPVSVPSKPEKPAVEPVQEPEHDSLRLRRLSFPVSAAESIRQVRRGSVVPTKTEPAKTRQPTIPGQDKDQDYGR